ncbi:MAG: hypothetical protein IJB16_08105, partial [Clostridia bacterium]|nr:hypothetical protein [Clostridia bacterium]
ESSNVKTPEYPVADTKFGITSAGLTGVYAIDGKTYITGYNFNEFTKVTVNGEPIDTDVLDMETLVTNHDFEIGNTIGTKQVATNLAILGESENTLTYSADMIIPENMAEETLDMILPTIEEPEETSEDSEEDATAEFATGQEDMDMRQQDING